MVLELAGLAPGPFAGMILSDFGARVIRVERPGQDISLDCLARGKESISLDLRSPEGADALRSLCLHADVLIDPYRPGALEGLGLSPATLLEDNPRLVVARLTGYGQTGPLSSRAGHDINYLAESGVLSACSRGPDDPPTPPVNLLADFAGGGMSCALGVMMALFEREKSGRGQTVDAAMVDGASYLATFLHKFSAMGMWSGPPGSNMLDGGAPFYDVYRCADGGWMAVGPIEPQFFQALVDTVRGADGASGADAWPAQLDQASFPALREKLRVAFLTRSRDAWTQAFAEADACVSPVLSLVEARDAPHAVARGMFAADGDGDAVPAPAPRLLRTPALAPGDRPSPSAGEHTDAILKEFGIRGAPAARL